MSDWQWLQIGIQMGIAIGQLAILWAVFKSLSSKVDSLSKEHYEHREKVAEKYATKKEVEKIFSKLENIRIEFQSMLMKFSERLEQKLEEIRNERKG